MTAILSRDDFARPDFLFLMALTDCSCLFTFWSRHPSLITVLIFPPHHSSVSQTGIQQGSANFFRTIRSILPQTSFKLSKIKELHSLPPMDHYKIITWQFKWYNNNGERKKNNYMLTFATMLTTFSDFESFWNISCHHPEKWCCNYPKSQKSLFLNYKNHLLAQRNKWERRDRRDWYCKGPSKSFQSTVLKKVFQRDRSEM